MKTIYIFRRNEYAATLAAYLHLHMKPPQNMNSFYYQEMKLYYVGMDSDRTEIYLLKYNMKKQILINILNGIGNIYNENIKIIELGELDGYLHCLLHKYRRKKYRKTLEEYINENNL